jgi:hypothetical protein
MISDADVKVDPSDQGKYGPRAVIGFKISSGFRATFDGQPCIKLELASTRNCDEVFYIDFKSEYIIQCFIYLYTICSCLMTFMKDMKMTCANAWPS